jgi:hypothetical protein
VKKSPFLAYLWIKNTQKRGLSTTFPQNVDIWIVTMWKCGQVGMPLYLVKKNFENQYLENQKS